MLDTRRDASAADGSAADDDLMLEVQAGSRQSFERLFERYRAPVWRFFRRRVVDGQRAEDLAQDVFAALLDAAPRYQPRAAFRSYLFGIAYNVLLADRRRTKGGRSDPLDADAVAAPAGDPDAALWVRRALSRLDPEEREILMLREYEQLSYQEIAELQGIPLNTVRTRLFRARLALREVLVPRTEEQDAHR